MEAQEKLSKLLTKVKEQGHERMSLSNIITRAFGEGLSVHEVQSRLPWLKDELSKMGQRDNKVQSRFEVSDDSGKFEEEEVIIITPRSSRKVSPFVTYRKQILGDYGTAGRLRQGVLSLYNWKNGFPLGSTSEFDDKHYAIFLELVNHYRIFGESDKEFLSLAEYIVDHYKKE